MSAHVSGEDPIALAAEQAALRRVATLVARAAAPEEVFAAITEEVGRLLPVDFADMSRCEPDGAVTFVAAWGSTAAIFPVGSRWILDGNNLCSIVARTGRPARIESYADASGPIDVAVRERGVRSAVGTPIMVEGRLWGVMAAGSRGEEPMPADTEARLTQFTELLATAVANAESRARLARLAEEQAALRRVATLIAHAAPYEELFDAVSQEVGTLFGADLAGMSRYEDDGTMTILPPWSAVDGHLDAPGRVSLEGATLPRIIRETGRPAREDAWDGVAGKVARDELGVRSAVGSPIVVDGRVWGVLLVSSTQSAHLPGDTESRLEGFTELVATAIANAQARAHVQRLVDEQAALRRVATLVAQDVPSRELFGAVAREVGTLLGADFSGMIRYEDDATVSTVATWAAVGEHPPVPDRWPTGPGDPTRMVAETRQAARVEDWAAVPGPIAAVIREELGVSSSVGCPIVVDGRLWGALAVHSTQREPLPPDTEARAAQFADLVATAIANAEARTEVTRLAHEQAALRRVATLVAREASQAEVFTAIAEEIGQMLSTEEIRMLRYDEDRSSARVVASWGDDAKNVLPIGARVPLDGQTAASQVFQTGRPVRIDDYVSVTHPVADTVRSIGIRTVAAAPIHVEGRLWGAMVTGTAQAEALPPQTEHRLGQFTALMATAIGNTESHAKAERLADEQAALRRVATLVAEGASPTAVFDAVAAEMERLLEADQVVLSRYEPGDEVVLLAHRGPNPKRLPPGTRVRPDDGSVSATVRRTKRPARMDAHQGRHGAVARLIDTKGLRAAVGAPITVDGRLWGVAVATWNGEEPPPADTEQRMAQFAELLDTAIANADSRDQLTASRTRLLTAGDEARRRVVRDLHDGAQQRLVHTIVTLKLAQRALQERDATAESLVGEALEQAQQGNVELRELAHGILPAVLTGGGLRAGVDAMVARLGLPVQVRVPGERLPAEIEASAYFIVAEALTNVVKHAQAHRAEVRASVDDGVLHVAVRDDGIGAADPDGHGLVAMADRVTALGGRLDIQSPAGGGTLLAATLPL
ncbi:MAG TPA: GAF domain-containing protein [Baekduia sp.]|uniref:GAF domain-containing protein n=1 Tax=Baekduia sp. TaxID=2600305 RepID=UPI002CEB5726|nr:GAF domain-containing protein [Baekduia sp.]HMJ36311.1 GAF domain-containing protein [Baekduia sp.]